MIIDIASWGCEGINSNEGVVVSAQSVEVGETLDQCQHITISISVLLRVYNPSRSPTPLQTKVYSKYVFRVPKVILDIINNDLRYTLGLYPVLIANGEETEISKVDLRLYQQGTQIAVFNSQ